MDKFEERNFMKEREQKTAAGAADCLQGDRLEAERLAGVQTFMEMTENGLVGVQIDETRFIEKKLHLKVNREKTEVGSAREMKFLGYSFYKSGEG